MKVSESLKIFRKELGFTQAELASKLNISTKSVSRWESDNSIPRTKTLKKLCELAEDKGVSRQCRRSLKALLTQGHKEGLRVPKSNLYSVERDSICQLVDDSNNAVYVADMERHELLYANHKAEEYFGRKFKTGMNTTCYEFLFGTKHPCEACPKIGVVEAEFSDAHVNIGDKYFHIRGRKIKWNDREAIVQYLLDETGALEAQNGMKQLLDSTKIGICVGNIYDDGRFELSYLNEGYYLMLGIRGEERIKFRGFSVLKGIVDEDRTRVKEEIFGAKKQNLEFEVIFRTRLPAGQIKWLNVKGQFVSKESDRSVYYCVISDFDKYKAFISGI